MASLLGKADPTLVTAAAREGLANVPGDYSEQFGIMADANKTLLTGVATAFKQYETGIKTQKKELDAAISDLQKYGAGIENNADSKKFQGEMDGQYNIYKENGGFKNDRPGFNEWQRQNNKIMSKYKNNNTMMMEAVESWQSGDSWTEGLTKKPDGPQTIGFFKSLTTYAKNVDDKSGIHNEKADNYMANNTGGDGDKKPEDLWKHLGAKDGEMVKYHDPATNEFTYITSVDGKVISKKSSEIAKMIPQKAIKPETDIRTRINERAKASNGAYSANDSQTNQNWLESLIDDAIEGGNEHALQYLMDQKYGGMDKSFIEALKDGTARISPAIATSLSKLGLGWVDQPEGKEGHGIFSREDFVQGVVGYDNYNTMVNEILYGKDNYELRRNLFVDDVDARGFKPAVEQGGKKNTDKTDYGMAMPKHLGGQYRSNEVVRDQANKLYTYEKDRLIGMSDGNYIVIEPGKTFKSTDSDDAGKVFTLQDIWDSNVMPSGLRRSVTPSKESKTPKQQGKTPEIETETDKDGVLLPKKKEGIVYNKPKPRTPSTESVIEESGLEGITEEKSGKLIKYYNYTGNDSEAANAALVKAKEAGIDDAFVKIFKDGKRISIEKYKTIMVFQQPNMRMEGDVEPNITFKVQLGVGRKSIVQEDVGVPEPSVTPVEDQDYGPDNPDPMAGTPNTSGDMILNESGEYIPIDSDEGKKIAKKYSGVQEVVKNNPVLKANTENTGNTNPLKYIIDNGYININEADVDEEGKPVPLVKMIDGVFVELLGTATDSLAVTRALTHDDKAWCGAFVYSVLTGTGAMKNIDKGDIQKDAAYSKIRAADYLDVGKPTDDPKMGDIMVVSRMIEGKKRHHVAFYAGTDDNGNPIMLGGNQDDEVSFKTVGKEYTIEGYRRMKNMSDIQEATVIAYKTKHGVKGGESKTI